MTHYNAIQARYPHVSGVFSFDVNGHITGIQRDFQYNGNHHIDVLHFLLKVLDWEKHHIQEFTDVKDLITTVHTLLINDPVMRVI